MSLNDFNEYFDVEAVEWWDGYDRCITDEVAELTWRVDSVVVDNKERLIWRMIKVETVRPRWIEISEIASRRRWRNQIKRRLGK